MWSPTPLGWLRCDTLRPFLDGITASGSETSPWIFEFGGNPRSSQFLRRYAQASERTGGWGWVLENIWDVSSLLVRRVGVPRWSVDRWIGVSARDEVRQGVHSPQYVEIMTYECLLRESGQGVGVRFVSDSTWQSMGIAIIFGWGSWVVSRDVRIGGVIICRIYSHSPASTLCRGRLVDSTLWLVLIAREGCRKSLKGSE